MRELSAAHSPLASEALGGLGAELAVAQSLPMMLAGGPAPQALPAVEAPALEPAASTDAAVEAADEYDGAPGGSPSARATTPQRCVASTGVTACPRSQVEYLLGSEGGRRRRADQLVARSR